MRVVLVGVSCVGKTTIGAALARRLGVPFFDLDAEIERHCGLSIERLQARCMTGYSYRKECSVVLERIVADNPDCVVATIMGAIIIMAPHKNLCTNWGSGRSPRQWYRAVM